MTGDGNTHQENFLTTVDIIYGAIMGAMITIWYNVLQEGLLAATVLVVFVFVLLTDDWYGSHFAATAHPYTFGLSLLDIVGVPVFFFLLYTGSIKTVYFCLAVVAYGTRGLLWDHWYIRNIKTDSIERSTIYLWSYYALSIIIVYLIVFLYFWYWIEITTLGISHTLALIGVWVIMRGTMEIIVRRKAKNSVEQSQVNEEGKPQTNISDFE